MKQLLLIELNEVNFEAVKHYAAKGLLPTFDKLIKSHGIHTTTSENEYENLEPWIQWITAHTGKTYSEHGVFRLGDIVNHDIPQIWEKLEQKGYSVGAISPMNAKNRTTNAVFFVPDPWTQTSVTGSYLLKKLSTAISSAVNNNATGKYNYTTFIWLSVAAAKYCRLKNYSRYFKLIYGSRNKKWNKALILDLLLHDVFVTLLKNKQPAFASIFLNAAAHIQHHYMLSSPAYPNDIKNPDWYVRANQDPLLDVYEQYDQLLTQIIHNFPSSQLMLATGLHQNPYPQLKYYWRLTNHSRFLNRIGIKFKHVEPRMSRDFLICCHSTEGAIEAESILNSAKVANTQLFEVDNRGTDLFVMLTYPENITPNLYFSVGNTKYENLSEEVVFVAIKNGEHSGIGYFVNTANDSKNQTMEFPLSELPHLVESALLTN